MKPARASGSLPAVIALHGHDSFKYYEFYDGFHKFDRKMQESAFARLGNWLGR